MQKATDAKEQTGIGQEKEFVALAYNSALSKKVSNGDSTAVTAEDMNTELTNQGATASGSNPIKVTFTASKRQYTINNNGIIEYAGTSNEENNPTELTISLEITHQDVAPTIGENITSVNSENIPIPTGFYAVAGTSKSTGFVISSVNGDDLNNSQHGNQFVWVPVEQNQKLNLEVSSPENITNIKLIDPFGDEINLGISGSIGKTYNNTNITPTVNGQYQVEVTTATETTQQTLVVRSLYAIDRFNDYWYTDEYAQLQEYESALARAQDWDCDSVEDLIAYENEKMKKYTDIENYISSVNTYGGFYVGRFEAGLSTKRTSGNANTSVDDIIIANGLPLSQKNKDTYTYITRSQAIGLAEKMYEGKSHLLTGAAWNRVLDWLINTNNKTLAQITGDSKSWGNYKDSSFTASGTGSIAKTAAFGNNTIANNIYDLAGNVYEWTSETNSLYPCVAYGGGYTGQGNFFSASYHNYTNESYFGNARSFRVALFL